MTNKKMNNVEILLSKLDKGKLSDFYGKYPTFAPEGLP